MNVAETLFKLQQENKTCRSCKNRQRWQCGGSIIQYCGIRESNRTFNKLMKIKCTRKACALYEEKQGDK